MRLNRSIAHLVPFIALASTLVAPAAAAETAYQKPPKNVLDVLHAPQPPYVAVSPTHDRLILTTLVAYPPIADLAQPFWRLAGVRVVSASRAIQNASSFSDYTVTTVADGAQVRVALPAGATLGWPDWTADGKRFAFTNTTPSSVELWVAEAMTGKARRIAGVRLNPFFGEEAQWMPDQRTLIVKLVPKGAETAPVTSGVPIGPNVQEASGESGASSTYELRDVLKSPRDEQLFDFYGTSQLALVDTATGKISMVGKPGLYATVSPAPDGTHILVGSIRRPYSYVTTHDRFPREVEIWDRGGRIVHRVASLPLADRVPIWGVPVGPRDFTWRATEPATLIWAEALDGGDWNAKVQHRDRVMMIKAPFQKNAAEVTRTAMRFEGLWWGEQPGTAFVREMDLIKHWSRTSLMNVDDLASPPRVLWDLSSDDRYKDPGNPVFRALPNGFPVVEQEGTAIYLRSQGATPEGDRPFLDKFDLASLTSERLFRCDATSFETFVAWSDLAAKRFLTRRESPTEPPNVFVRSLDKPIPDAPAGEARWTASLRAVTRLTDPTPEIRGIQKRLVKYKRADGVDLSFTLYLPPGYQEGTRLPTVVGAYPLDYADPKMAGQVMGSTQRFTTLGWPLYLFLLLDGYAVIHNPSLPVVGDTNKIYDTYMDQLVSGAKAAVAKAVELGVTDPDRIGITGHSHGGLMTVNLLTHSDLFRAGVAQSGAYNRSLTPFGFQNERRTIWEATDVYVKVSPFFHANKLKRPLLLIHGEADANPGTVPLQSEKLFEAVRGTGGTVRLVMLPFESHGYRAMESTEHALYEILSWFDKYVKRAPPRERGPSRSEAALSPK